MTKQHPHHDLIVEWAKDTTQVVQVSDPRFADKCWIDASDPTWQEDLEYRFNPTPKPDVVQELVCTMTGVRTLEHWSQPNLRLTFDGETGALKSAEVIK